MTARALIIPLLIIVYKHHPKHERDSYCQKICDESKIIIKTKKLLNVDFAILYSPRIVLGGIGACVSKL